MPIFGKMYGAATADRHTNQHKADEVGTQADVRENNMYTHIGHI